MSLSVFIRYALHHRRIIALLVTYDVTKTQLLAYWHLVGPFNKVHMEFWRYTGRNLIVYVHWALHHFDGHVGL